VVVLIIIVGGFFAWQYWWVPEEEVKVLEEKIEEAIPEEVKKLDMIAVVIFLRETDMQEFAVLKRI